MSTPEPQPSLTSTTIAVWAVLGLCALSPGSMPTTSVGATGMHVSDYDPERVTPQQAKERRAKGEDLLLVDVRPFESYKLEHITGAISSPWRDLPDGHQQLPKERLMLLYCT